MKRFRWKEAFKDAHEGAQAEITGYQTFVGYCHSAGHGVKRDLKKAKLWYGRAAKKGEADAISSLAVIYYKGIGRWCD